MKWSLKELSQPSWKQLAKLCQEKIALLEKEADIQKALILWQDASQHLRELTSYGLCLISEDVNSKEGTEASSLSIQLQSVFEQITVVLDQRMAKELSQDKTLEYPLALRCLIASQKMDTKREGLLEALSPFGFHAWQEMYKTLIGNLQVSIEEKTFSIGQLDNLFSDSKRATREAAFNALEEILKKHEMLFANILRSILGFRLCLYKNRGWKNPYQEALWNNHMEQKTLDTMWETVEKNAHLFQQFCIKKAQLLQLEKLSWFDLEAPISSSPFHFSYQETCQKIVAAFSVFSPEFANFCKNAISSQWIEAEDRKRKAPGGFCTTFPLTKTSRIFMTFAGTMPSTLVLAHELGHAFHNHILFDAPEIHQLYPMSLAETASTVAELLFLDGLCSACMDKKEKKAYLLEKAQRSTTFFLNIRARFLFEKICFEKAKDGFLSAEDFSEIMEISQKQAYGDTLERYHPYFWISKLHFYLTELPCYNFPYTCGYLISLAIYAKAKKDPSLFESWYIAFLKDTGSYSVEEVIKKHFGIDPQEPEFWQMAIDVAKRDVYDLLEISDE